MKFKEAYRLGQERKGLEVVAQNYNAWPRGLTISGGSGVETMVNDISNMTQEVRETAQQKAGKIETPKNILGKIGFNLGCLVGPYRIITDVCTSNGPVNPFTNKTLY